MGGARLVLTALAVMALLPPSCGGEGEPTSPRPQADAFVVRAEAICEQTEEEARRFNEEIAGAGLLSPDSARYLRRGAAIERRGVERLSELRPPPERSDTWRDFITEYRLIVAKLEQVAAATARGDEELARTIQEDANSSTEDRLDPLAAELGIDACASG